MNHVTPSAASPATATVRMSYESVRRIAWVMTPGPVSMGVATMTHGAPLSDFLL